MHSSGSPIDETLTGMALGWLVSLTGLFFSLETDSDLGKSNSRMAQRHNARTVHTLGTYPTFSLFSIMKDISSQHACTAMLFYAFVFMSLL